MNWKEFKEFVELQGVTDEIDLDYIDLSQWDLEHKQISIYVDLNFGVIIE